MARVADFPASGWIRFLSAYGPDSSNNNLFDENVGLAARRNKIEPFELETDYVPQIVELLKEDSPSNVLIAGVAGDGKSYHLRQVWSAFSHGGLDSWEKDGDVTIKVQKKCGSYRNVTFIKDLSANVTKFAELLNRLENIETSDEIFVIACNHGQILARFREHDRLKIADELEEIFFSQDAESSVGNFRVFDLSRTSQSNKLKEIIEIIATHPKWNDCIEKKCPHCDVCPIRRNVRTLWDYSRNQASVTTSRLCRLVEMAAYNGQHFPVRDLFVLAVNAILGCSSERAIGRCHDVDRFVSQGKTGYIDIFVNLLGENLGKAIRTKNVVFRAVEEFEVGLRGNSYFDELIVLGKKHPETSIRNLYQQYFGNEDIFLNAVEENERKERLKAARRKLFFLWNEEDSKDDRVWALTAYSHFPKYLLFREDVRDDPQLPEVLIQGLARIMTGSVVSEESSLSVSTNGASSRALVGMLVSGTISTDAMLGDGCVSAQLSGTGNDATPELIFRLSPNPLIRYAITPKRYEFLSCVREGYVPTSFSGQCQAEFYSLKARLVNALLRRNGGVNSKTILRFRFADKSLVTLRLSNDS